MQAGVWRWGLLGWVGTVALMGGLMEAQVGGSVAAGSALSVGSATTGVVVGRVQFEETGFPARLVPVRLIPLPASPANEEGAGRPAAMDADAEAERRRTAVARVDGRTGLDGGFRMEGVPAGTYLVAAHVDGFVAPGGLPDWRDVMPAEETERLLRGAPTVRVGPGQVSEASVVLRRGGAIAGRVEYPDGSPMVGTAVQLLPSRVAVLGSGQAMQQPNAQQSALLALLNFSNSQPYSTTDDRGRFRLSGISPGRYVVQTTIPGLTNHAVVAMEDGSVPSAAAEVNNAPPPTVVYAPGRFRRSQAKMFVLRGAEEIGGADLVIDAAGTHTIRGRVVSAADGHPLAAITIQVKEVKGQAAGGERKEGEGEDSDPGAYTPTNRSGFFELPYMLPGTFRLTMEGPYESVAPDLDKPDVARLPILYKDFERTIVVGDGDAILDDILLLPRTAESAR